MKVMLMRLKLNKRKLGLIILSIFLPLVLADSLITNWLLSHGATEANPIVAGIAGTGWLVVVKVGWVVLCLALLLLVKDKEIFRKRKHEQNS
jgi:ABC-type transport system involved in multi-copper enzyme maturation permease subunit